MAAAAFLSLAAVLFGGCALWDRVHRPAEQQARPMTRREMARLQRGVLDRVVERVDRR